MNRNRPALRMMPTPRLLAGLTLALALAGCTSLAPDYVCLLYTSPSPRD